MVSVHECIYKPNVWNRVNCVQNTIRECDLTEACFFKVNFPVYQKCALFAGMWPDRSLPTEGATTWFTKVYLFTQPLLMWLWIKDFFQKIAFHRLTFPPLILACLPYCVNKYEQTNKSQLYPFSNRLIVMNSAEEKLRLKWIDFHENIKVSFTELRDDKDFSDVTLN